MKNAAEGPSGQEQEKMKRLEAMRASSVRGQQATLAATGLTAASDESS